MTASTNEALNTGNYMITKGNTLSDCTPVSVKDELQTVPIHPVNGKSSKKEPPKRKSQLNGASGKPKSGSGSVKMNSSGSSVDSSVESVGHPLVAGSLHMDRRDTGNSTASSSNLDAYSPINLDKQETLKLEKKRERNREAARKCRTRKLEKIAVLEIQVKNLTDANKLEKSKTDSLRDEINEFKQKLEMHKKMHNCDLKINI